MTEEYIRYVQQVAYETDCVSLNLKVDGRNAESDVDTELGELVANKCDAFEEFNKKEMRNYLFSLIKRVKNLSVQKVLILRYGFDGYNDYRTLEEIGNMFGVTRERIRQLEIKGLKELSNIMMKEGVKYEDFI